MQVSDLYYKKYLKYKNKYLNLLKQIGGHSIYIEINDVVLPRDTETIDLTTKQLSMNDFNLLIQYLRHFINLKNLILTNTGIQSNHATRLAEALRNNQKLETLNISNNNIGDEGATSIVSILNTLPRLNTLNLTNCNISDNIAITIKPTNTSISIIGI